MSADAFIRFHGAPDLLSITALYSTQACRAVQATGQHCFTDVISSDWHSTGQRVCLGCGVLTDGERSAMQDRGWGRA
jgi:hypothetical protein